MKRNNLQAARQAKGMTQQQMADYLHVTLRHYKKIESGETLGSIMIWDALEELLNVHQMELRSLSDQEENPQTHPEHQQA